MASIKKFCDLALSQVNKGIYVWGANGELLSAISPSWIKSHEDSDANYKKALEMYNKRKGVAGARAFDCSGFVCWCLRECGAVAKGYDKTANGLMSVSDKISKSSLKDGDFCFKVKDGKAHHIGIYVGGKIIEAKGRAYGVVSSAISSSWNAFGRIKIKWDAEPQKFVLTRVLKRGCEGEDVKWVQEALIKRGYRLQNNKGTLKNNGADGKYGDLTERRVRSFQVDHRLGVDGKVGKQTITALGGTWK